jgi:radical SAM protein with 4Fe4S-binding SPASM domain
LYSLPNSTEYLRYIERHTKKEVVLTTNAGLMDYVPEIDCLVLSFNGVDRQGYEYTTGMSFSDVVQNIKSAYTQLSKVPDVQMHILMWQGNQDEVDKIKDIFGDFPGRIRISYKYDNQMKEDYTIDEYKSDSRSVCDYLTKSISIMPDGSVIACAHDFDKETFFGNIFKDAMDEILNSDQRQDMMAEHKRGEFKGICTKCNFNTPIDGRVFYIKK